MKRDMVFKCAWTCNTGPSP